MKRYLARLAERAALATPPLLPVAGTGAVADPFETIAPMESAPVAARAPETRSAPLNPPVPPPPTRTVAPPPVPVETPIAPKRETVVRERVVETIRPTPPPNAEPPRTVPAPRTMDEPPPLQPSSPPSIERVLSPAPPEKADAGETSERVRIVEQQREQQQLLRKADAFMGALLDRRPPAPAEPESRLEETRPALEPRIEREPAPRLQPQPQQQRMPEPPPEPPSLVIGKLTVEVVSPAPPAPPQRPRIVVVRGAGAGRPPFPSSRRFGLGQF